MMVMAITSSMMVKPACAVNVSWESPVVDAVIQGTPCGQQGQIHIWALAKSGATI